MSLSIGYDATAAVRQGAGIGRYTRQLLAALAARDDPYSYKVYYAAGGAPIRELPLLDARFHVRSVPVSDRFMNIVWHRSHLPIPVQLFTGRIDLFHSPDFTLPPARRIPRVLTIHDLAFLTVPECAYPTLRVYLERVVPRSARAATRLIAVSESTRRDLIDFVGIAPERVVTVLEGVGPEFRPVERTAAAREIRTRLGIEQPFILAVGTLEPRKNYPRLFEAYAQLRQRGVDHRLVVAGGRGWLYEPALRRVRELRLSQHVSFVQPSDSELVALYGAADAFVYPSLYEGFGMPPLEALACGVPVACSSAASLPEVVGDAALLFDPLSVDEMTEAIYRLVSDADLARDLRRKGPERAREFTWERAAEQTVRVYQEATADA